MSDLHEQESDFLRIVQQAPLADPPRDEHREALRRQALAAFDRARERGLLNRWQEFITYGRDLMRRPLPRLLAIATACLLLAAAWLFIPGHQSSAQAFNRFASAIVAAKTARFQMEIDMQGQPKQKFQAFYLAPGKFRQELGPVVNISDFPAGKVLTLIPDQKKAVLMNLQGATAEERAKSNYFERMRLLLSKERDADDEHYQPLGEKEIDGHRAVGFRWDSPAATPATSTLWGDPATGQPVRIESTWNGLPPTKVVMSDFQINVELPASLFDMTPPAGYQVQSLDVDSSKPAEKDLVKALRSFCDLSGGEFPSAFNVVDLTQQLPKLFLSKYSMEKGKGPTDAQVQEMMQISLAIGRGFQFVLELPPSAEAHYAGKDVKRDTAGRAIFWYKPEGAKKYRVIYADFSVQDADSAPEVAGAVLIGNAGKADAPPGK